MGRDSFAVGKGRLKPDQYWSPSLPSQSFLEERPVFFVVAQKGLDDRYRLSFPHPKPFASGYDALELNLFDPLKRMKYCPFFPLMGKLFMCRWDNASEAFSSTMAVRIMYGEVKCMTIEEASGNERFFNKSFRSLYEAHQDGGVSVATTRIVCGSVLDETSVTTPDDLVFFHARTTKVLASNVAVRDKGEPFAVIGAAGDCYYVSPPAQAIFDGANARLPQLEAA